MPRQHELPHTAGKPGPCDAARDAYLDAAECASEAASEKKRKLSELLDRMLETGISRVPCVDRKTNRHKWLEITEGEPRLRAVKAEADSEPRSKRGPHRRTNAALATVGPLMSQEEAEQWRTESGQEREDVDPFSATREALPADRADEPENRTGLPVARAEADRATAGRQNAPVANGEPVDDGDDGNSSMDLRTAGQQRRRVRR